jgi:peroxiredoxin
LAVACLLLISTLGVLAAGSAENRAREPRALPAFALADTAGTTMSSADLRGKITVLYFYSVRCPASNDYSARITALARRFGSNPKVRFVGIHSTAKGYSVSPQQIAVMARVNAMTFPTLCDADGKVAADLGVTRTPTVVIVDENGMIRYRGALDDNSDPSRVKTSFARQTVEALLRHQPIAYEEGPAIGTLINRAH